MLDTATARVCLMSQRADGGLMHATAPHAASYFYLSKGGGGGKSFVCYTGAVRPQKGL